MPSWTERLTWRRRDQVALAGLTVCALAALWMAWWCWGGWEGSLAELDELPAAELHFLVDVNTAPWPELALLPGVGPKLAQRIVERREAVGPFTAADQLLSVSGIGRITLEKIKPHLAPLPGEPSGTAP